MQFESKQEFSAIAGRRGYDLYYAAVLDENGIEKPITQQMIDQLYERLCAENTIREAISR